IDAGLEEGLDRERELRALRERVADGLQLLPLERSQPRGTGLESDRAQAILGGAAEDAAQRPERCAHDPAEQVSDGLPHYGGNAELRVHAASRNRHADIDAAVLVLEDRDRQLERQVQCRWALHPLAQL